MLKKRRPWQEELAIIDQTMRAISGVSDPDKLVQIYWDGIGDLIAIDDYVGVSRREIDPPYFLVTRSSRFTEHFNPWTQRDRLPRLSGGVLGEIAYADRPLIWDDLPARLAADDPGRFYLEGFQSLVTLPHYDAGEALNTTVLLLPPGESINYDAIPMLYWQSGLFGRGTQNLVLRNQLADALATLDRELQVVGAIQRSLLPRELPPIPGFDLAAHYQTSAWAGGDYYDFFPLPDGKWGLFIGDVSGHGTPAAVMMAITHAAAHAQPGMHVPPAALLGFLNQQLSRASARDESFVTAFYGVLDPRSRRLTYASAGHNPPRLARRGTMHALDGVGSLPLGILDEQSYDEATVTLEPDDLLLLYTDGITEAAAGINAAQPGELFGVERLDALLLDGAADSAEGCLARIRSEVGAFCDHAPPIDDQTLIAIRCL